MQYSMWSAICLSNFNSCMASICLKNEESKGPRKSRGYFQTDQKEGDTCILHVPEVEVWFWLQLPDRWQEESGGLVVCTAQSAPCIRRGLRQARRNCSEPQILRAGLLCISNVHEHAHSNQHYVQCLYCRRRKQLFEWEHLLLCSNFYNQDQW